MAGPDQTTGGLCQGTADCRDVPFPVPGLPALAQISSGSFHTCGLTTDGTAWCWGLATGTNESGGLGPPTPVPGGYSFVSIGAGRYHNCALTSDGIAYCWTPGESGAWLCGPTECSETPVAVGTRTFRALAVGSQHTCALDLSGFPWCWGLNWMGETGSPPSGQAERVPIQASDSLAFETISANHGYTCALTLEGELYCWGWGDNGQLAVADPPICGADLGGDILCSPRPLHASTDLLLLGLSAGFTHACALSRQKQAICWGDNGQGQLGDAIFGTRKTPGPTTAHSWSFIEPGMGMTCGIATSGRTYCWGLNRFGQLGAGVTTELSTTPLEVAGGHHFAELSAGLGHACGLTHSGAVYCWGDNGALQLGGR